MKLFKRGFSSVNSYDDSATIEIDYTSHGGKNFPLKVVVIISVSTSKVKRQVRRCAPMVKRGHSFSAFLSCVIEFFLFLSVFLSFLSSWFLVIFRRIGEHLANTR